MKKKRVTKTQWLEQALEVLEKEGVSGIRIERLARDIEVSKSGFYWHFRNRDDLLNQILDFWDHEFTEVISRNPEIAKMPPLKRLETILETIVDHGLNRYTISIQAWAKNNPAVDKRFNAVIEKRLSYIRGTFRELGFRGNDLEIRTRLFVTAGGWPRPMFFGLSKKEIRKHLKIRCAFLTRK